MIGQHIWAVCWGSLIGILGGLIGLGGAEFRLPVLVGVFNFRTLQAIVINLIISLVTVVFSFIFRTGLVNLDRIVAHTPVILNILAGSLIGSYVGVHFATNINERALNRIVVALLISLSAVLIGHDFIFQNQGLHLPTVWRVALGFGAGIVIGMFSSMLGVAGGELIIPTLDNGQSFIATLANPFPDGFQLPPGSSQGLSASLGRAISFFNEEPLNPYIQRWSLSVQRELPGRIVAEVSYVGSRGTKLGVQRNLNPIPRQYLSTRNERDQPVIDFLSAAVRNPFFGLPEFAGSGLASQDVARSQLLRPYPHFGDINVTEPTGYSWYHALQAGVEKRFTKGLTFQASWTYSKFMEAISYLNDTDPRPEEVISDQDFPHRFVLNGIYELPFGKGRKWLNDNKWADYAVGGWQLQGWFEGQSGEALGFGNAIVRGDLRDIVLPADKRTSERWFNLDAANTVFERDNGWQLASNVRTLPTRFSYIRADGVNNFDISLFKNFRITEGVKIQFRAESFNALNHVQFTNPNTAVANTAFGTINGEKGHGQRQFTFGLKVLF